jgi:type IV pilus assembly protein PilE
MNPPTSPRSRRLRGFTLIELMIAIVIVAILAAVAMPSFLDSIRKGRRSEAFAALNQVQQTLERWRSNNATYTTNLTAAPPAGLGLPSTTTNGNYTISIPAADGVGYEVRATAVGGTSQSKDGSCTTLGVRLGGDPASAPRAGGNVEYASASLVYGPTNPCWSR